MLRKVLKYDLKYVWRIWWIMAVIVTGLSLVGSISLRLFLEQTINSAQSVDPTLTISLFLLMFGCIIAIFGSSIGTVIIVYSRFYKSFFTDEGYLTFTLPVSRKTLFFAKTLNTMIWTVAQSVLMVGCISMFLLISPPANSGIFNFAVFEGLGEGFSFLFENLGAWSIGYVFVFLVLSVASMLFSAVIIQLCITVGAIIAKKNKLLAAIGIYFGFNMVFSIVSQIISTGGLRILVGTADKVFSGITYVEQVHLLLFATVLLAAAITVTVAIAIWCGTLGLIERKLNLA